MQLEGGAIGRRRTVEGDAGAHILQPRLERRLVGRGANERLHGDGEFLRIAASPFGADGSCWQHHLANIARRADRMRTQAIRDFAGHPAHHRIDGCHVDRNIRELDRAGIEQRHHQRQLVMRSLVIEGNAVLPAAPDRAHGQHIVSHPRARRVERQAITANDVAAHLAAETQNEAALRKFGQRPRRHRRRGRAAWKGHRHRRRQSNAACGGGGQCHHLIGVLLGFLDRDAVKAQVLDQPRVSGDGCDIERLLGGAKSRIELAERQQGFDTHAAGPCGGRSYAGQVDLRL